MKRNTIEDWILSNTSGPPAVHPFHIHINPFQVLEIAYTNSKGAIQTYKPTGPPIWQDVGIPVGGWVRIRHKFADFTGTSPRCMRRRPEELEEHEKLYGIFVEEAVHLSVDSIQRSASDPAKIMRLYSKVARIRLTSSDRVLRAAEEVGKRLLEAYERPPGDPAEVLARYANGEENLDPLREFTEACRQERANALQRV